MPNTEASDGAASLSIRGLAPGRFPGGEHPGAQQRSTHMGLTVVVLGASGDLAKKKTYPALWQ